MTKLIVACLLVLAGAGLAVGPPSVTTYIAVLGWFLVILMLLSLLTSKEEEYAKLAKTRRWWDTLRVWVCNPAFIAGAVIGGFPALAASYTILFLLAQGMKNIVKSSNGRG